MPCTGLLASCGMALFSLFTFHFPCQTSPSLRVSLSWMPLPRRHRAHDIHIPPKRLNSPVFHFSLFTFHCAAPAAPRRGARRPGMTRLARFLRLPPPSVSAIVGSAATPRPPRPRRPRQTSDLLPQIQQFLGNLVHFHSERWLRGVYKRTSPLIFGTGLTRASQENHGGAFCWPGKVPPRHIPRAEDNAGDHVQHKINLPRRRRGRSACIVSME